MDSVHLTRREALVILHLHKHGLRETAKRFDVSMGTIKKIRDKAMESISKQAAIVCD